MAEGVRSILTLILVLQLLSSCSFTWAWGWNTDKVKLVDVTALTLTEGHMTRGRRSSPVPQLACVGGTARCEFQPKVVQCYNRGNDGYDVQWECKTDLADAYRFGTISVSCEGYDHPNDPYVLKGSCGLEYNIDLTEKGLQDPRYYKYFGGKGLEYRWDIVYQRSYLSQLGKTFLKTILVGALLIFMAYTIYKWLSPARPTQKKSNSGNNGPTGGNPDTAPSAPPPPGFRAQVYQGSATTNPQGGTSTSPGTENNANNNSGARSSRTNNNTDDDTCGFWTGAAIGALTGYIFGSGSGNRNTSSSPTSSNRTSASAYRTSSSYRAPSSSSNYRSGTGFASTTRRTETGSSGTRTASGFGGTTRR